MTNTWSLSSYRAVNTFPLHYKQYRQCTYNVILMCFRANIVAVEKQWALHNVSVCIFSLMYLACSAHAAYCHLWAAPLYNNFPLFLVKGTILYKKKLLNTKCVFWFSLQLYSDTFLILRRNEWGIIKNYIGLHVKYPLLMSDFNESWIFSTDFRTIL